MCYTFRKSMLTYARSTFVVLVSSAAAVAAAVKEMPSSAAASRSRATERWLRAAGRLECVRQSRWHFRGYRRVPLQGMWPVAIALDSAGDDGNDIALSEGPKTKQPICVPVAAVLSTVRIQSTRRTSLGRKSRYRRARKIISRPGSTVAVVLSMKSTQRTRWAQPGRTYCSQRTRNNNNRSGGTVAVVLST